MVRGRRGRRNGKLNTRQKCLGCRITVQTWQNFQLMFAEAGYSVYESRELVEVPNAETEEQRQIEKLAIGNEGDNREVS